MSRPPGFTRAGLLDFKRVTMCYLTTQTAARHITIMSVSSLNTCSPSTFGGLSFFGAKVLSIDANLVTNFSASVPAVSRVVQPAVELRNATFCNVTVTYTHPGQGDNINVETWLPVGTWNGRLQAVGGAGWAAGRLSFAYEPMKGALADGYATVTTDAGLGAAQEPSPWALVSQGNVNLYNLQNFGSVSLNDQATIAKSVIRSFYGQDPTFSYWTGCSQGGRQGLALAQRYPTAYDGILAGAPVVYATEVVGSMFWPQQVMSMLGQHPFGCEIRAMTTAAISACDGLDGVVDGVIANPEACLGTFDPFILVGQQTDCPEANKSVQISTTAAIVTNATWRGRITADGRPAWHGFNPDTDIGIFSSDPRMLSGVAATNCTSGTCIGVVNLLVTGWLTQFIAKGARLDFGNITHVQADGLIHAGRQQYGSIFDADDPDLTEFRAAGGKLVTYHGMASLCLTPVLPVLTSCRLTVLSRRAGRDSISTKSLHGCPRSMAFTVITRSQAWHIASVVPVAHLPASSISSERGSKMVRRWVRCMSH